MAALPAVGFHQLLDGDWLRIELHLSSEFPPSGGVNPILSGFFIPDDSSGNVPSGTIGGILPPGEQGTSSVVLDQKIDVYQWRKAAEEKKKFLGQPVEGLSHPSVQRFESLPVNLFLHLATIIQNSNS
jgi:hypothetical protein